MPGSLTLAGSAATFALMQAATLEILEKAKVPAEQARAIAQAIEIELGAQRDTLATKLDLADVRRELEVRIETARRELEVRIESAKSALVRWVFLCILGQTAVLLGAAYFFVTRLR